MKKLEFGNGNLLVGTKGYSVIVSSLDKDNVHEIGEDATNKFFSDEKDEVELIFNNIDSIDVLMHQINVIKRRLQQNELNVMQRFRLEVMNALSEERKLDALVVFCNTGKYPDYA